MTINIDGTSALAFDALDNFTWDRRHRPKQAGVGARYEILLYHGVHADDLDAGARNRSGKHISRARFATEMEYLKRSRPIVSMRQIAAAHRGEIEIPEGAVAVTFDDGFLNNYTEAFPVLKEHGVPATIYVATGYIGTGRRMWSDRLEDAFLRTVERRMSIAVRGERFDAGLATTDDRVAAFLAVKQRCKMVADELKNEIVDAVCETLAVEPEPCELYDFCDWDDVRDMAFSGLVDIGAHTVDHVSLAKCTSANAAAQIRWSLAAVSDALADECDLFAYPEGQAHDFNELTIACLMAHGIDHTPSAMAGTNQVGVTDPFALYRTMVGFENAPFPL